MKKISFSLSVLVLTSLLLFSGCKKDDDDDIVGPDVDFYALSANNQLLKFNGKNTTSATSTMSISGLQTGETILGIDFRPGTGQLFGIGSTSRIYVINFNTGAATAVGTTAFAPILSGSAVGFDFNPTVDRIRLVSSTGQNLRLNPETGGVAATDGAINGATASVHAVAYTQNRAGATSTVLYDIDVTNNKLYRQDPPNNGTLIEVGNLGVDAEAAGGFDISADSAHALAALTVSGQTGLYTINLGTGAATKVGDFNSNIVGIAIPTPPVAYAVSTSNSLLILNPVSGDISFTKPVTGLQTSENIVGLDMRPATGQLFALGSTSRLYTINASTGAATQVGTAVMTPVLAGTEFAFDFNPTVDRIRIVSNTGQNLRVNPADATVTVDGVVNPVASVISGAGYTNSFAGATSTVLFDIDASADRLVRQDPPNNGTIVDIGALGVNIDAANGFDIAAYGGQAYGLFTVSGTTRLYTVNLTTGAATAGPNFAQAARGFTLGLGL